jgi:hypothetical protein
MKIELNDPSAAKGKQFYVNDLGSLENGKAVEFSDEEVAVFELAQGRSIKEAFAANPNIKLSVVKGGDDS